MKNILFKNIMLFVLLAGFVLPTFAQTTPLEVKIVNEQIVRSGNNVLVNLEFILDDVAVRSNDMVIYTPVIVSTRNKVDRAELPPVVLTGNRRNKILKRQQRLQGAIPIAAEPIKILNKKRNKQQTIEYSITIPYSEWMQGASLAVETAISGCADCFEPTDALFVAGNIMPSKVLPTFTLVYIEPDVEEVKARADRHAATFNFVVNRTELLRDYKDNRAKFEEVDRIITEITTNKDIEIKDFNIAGYASPEGSMTHNKTLAEERAKIFAHYLVTKFDITADKFVVESFGEDWDGLRKAVEKSTLADKAEVIRIIETVSNLDARDEPLRRLSSGSTYNTLLNSFYPPLRRTEYTIAYVVRSFDVEEAKEIIKTNPKLLSLNEMYMVAHSYGAGTREFKEVFDIAVRMYPDSEIAILNSAAADIENNAVEPAIVRMQKLDDSPKAWNNMGVAYALKGDLDKALELFGKAAKTNDVDAVHNLEKLQKYMDGME